MEWFSWSAVFGINVTLAVLALLATVPIVPTSRGSLEARLDPVGALLSSAGLFALVFAIIEAPQTGSSTRSRWRGSVSVSCWWGRSSSSS